MLEEFEPSETFNSSSLNEAMKEACSLQTVERLAEISADIKLLEKFFKKRAFPVFVYRYNNKDSKLIWDGNRICFDCPEVEIRPLIEHKINIRIHCYHYLPEMVTYGISFAKEMLKYG